MRKAIIKLAIIIVISLFLVTWGISESPPEMKENRLVPQIAEQQAILIIPVEFSDVKGSRPIHYIEKMVADYAELPGIPPRAIRNYWIPLKNPVSAYVNKTEDRNKDGVADIGMSYIKNVNKLIVDACQAAVYEGARDLSSYDKDKDGFIDYLVIVFAGEGQDKYGVRHEESKNYILPLRAKSATGFGGGTFGKSRVRYATVLSEQQNNYKMLEAKNIKPPVLPGPTEKVRLYKNEKYRSIFNEGITPQDLKDGNQNNDSDDLTPVEEWDQLQGKKEAPEAPIDEKETAQEQIETKESILGN